MPSNPSSTYPLQFQRSQDLYIISSLQLNCDTSLSMIMKWTINKCSSTCSSEIQLDQTIITTRSELFIPPQTLPYGTYKFTLAVTMLASLNSSSSASVYVTINPSGIIANLFQFGISMIVHGYQQDLTLNPGAFSVDPDAVTFNASVKNDFCI